MSQHPGSGISVLVTLLNDLCIPSWMLALKYASLPGNTEGSRIETTTNQLYNSFFCFLEIIFHVVQVDLQLAM